MLIFNENKRYDVKQNMQAVSTLSSMKPTGDGYWVTELPDVRRRFSVRQKITYLLTIVDPTTIEIQNQFAQNKICEMRPPRQDAHLTKESKTVASATIAKLRRGREFGMGERFNLLRLPGDQHGLYHHGQIIEAVHDHRQPGRIEAIAEGTEQQADRKHFSENEPVVLQMQRGPHQRRQHDGARRARNDSDQPR